jgi:hypothetical protein
MWTRATPSGAILDLYSIVFDMVLARVYFANLEICAQGNFTLKLPYDFLREFLLVPHWGQSKEKEQK